MPAGRTLCGNLRAAVRQGDGIHGTARARDEVTVGNSIYMVVDLEADAEGGIRLVLHFNRSV